MAYSPTTFRFLTASTPDRTVAMSPSPPSATTVFTSQRLWRSRVTDWRMFCSADRRPSRGSGRGFIKVSVKEQRDPIQHQHALVARIAARKTQVGVMGLGHIGLPLALAASECGFRLTGFDVD